MEIDIDKIVNEYKPESIYGFSNEEIQRIIKENFPVFSMDKYNNAMMGNTGISIDGKFRNYPWDVKAGLRCGLEDRDLTLEEWD